MGSERTDFRHPAKGGVKSSPDTTLENNDKFRRGERAENGFAGGYGGGKGTGVEQSLQIGG